MADIETLTRSENRKQENILTFDNGAFHEVSQFLEKIRIAR